MTLKEELYILFDQGKSPKECIDLGYKRATVYRFLKDYNIEKEKERIKTLVEESEQIKKAFQGFKENKSLIDMVTEYGISPDRLRQLYEEYTKLGEIETQYKEKVEALNEAVRRKEDLEAKTKEIEQKYSEFKKKLKQEIIQSVKDLDLSVTDYLESREAYLQLFLDTPIEGVDYSGMERELKLVQKFLYGSLLPPCTIIRRS